MFVSALLRDIGIVTSGQVMGRVSRESRNSNILIAPPSAHSLLSIRLHYTIFGNFSRTGVWLVAMERGEKGVCDVWL